MAEIKCPNCGTVIQLDESQYSAIVNQVRNAEFEKSVSEREKNIRMEAENKKQLEEIELKAKHKDELSVKNQEIEKLKNQLAQANFDKRIAVSEAESASEKMISELRISLETEKRNHMTDVKNVQETMDQKLKLAQEETAYYKDFKAKQSTKMIGEDLEQHCLNEFNKVRAYAFPTAYFEKDNEVSKESGSKGDFIFRDYIDGDTSQELVSIMFDMKNEADMTATKKTNESFLKELDKDRHEKGCEYAVLVSMLEADNEFYNTGIVDMSHRYPKMFVIRPQFFLTLIGILRNASLKSVEARKELVLMKNQNIDITHFEDDLNLVKPHMTKVTCFHAPQLRG